MTKNLRRLLYYFAYLMLAWSLFRYFVRLPEVIEELWLKPVIWLAPLFWWQFSLKNKAMFFGGKWWSTLGWGLVGGVIYLLVIKFLGKNSPTLDLNLVSIAMVTAVVEELTFSGFLLSILMGEKRGETWSLCVLGVLFSLIHVPILLFVFHLPIVPLIASLGMAFFVAMINGFLRLRSKNVLSAIVAHAVYLVMVLG